MSFGTCISKTPCQTHGYRGMGLAWCFAYVCTKTHSNHSNFGGDIAQIGSVLKSGPVCFFPMIQVQLGPGPVGLKQNSLKTRPRPWSTSLHGLVAVTQYSCN